MHFPSQLLTHSTFYILKKEQMEAKLTGSQLSTEPPDTPFKLYQPHIVSFPVTKRCISPPPLLHYPVYHSPPICQKRIRCPIEIPTKISTLNCLNSYGNQLNPRSPPPRKINIRYYSPPRIEKKIIESMPVFVGSLQTMNEREPRPKILDRKKNQKKYPTAMEITFNPVKAVKKMSEAGMKRVSLGEEKIETPVKHLERKKKQGLELGNSKQTYKTINGDQNSDVSIQDHL